MKLEIPITVEFDDVWEMVDEIKALQTYKLSEDDDMLLVDREDVADILKKHVMAKPKQPEQLGTNLAEVGTEPTNIVKNCNDKSSGSDDYSYKTAGGGTEQKYDPFVWNDNTDGLIDRAHLLKRLQDFVEWCRDDRLDGTKFCIDVIKDEPSAQAEIIRCKDCKWFGRIGCAISIVDDSDKPTENDFCSFAERREE